MRLQSLFARSLGRVHSGTLPGLLLGILFLGSASAGFGAEFPEVITPPGSPPPGQSTPSRSTPGQPPTSPPTASPTIPQAVADPEMSDRITSGSKPGAPLSPEVDNRPRSRYREGTKLVDRRGRFEFRGDRVIFLATSPDAHFVVLENLSLERVTRVLEESGSQLEWSVSGTISEFRTTNYLQITRVLVKSLPAKSEPRKLADPLAGSPPGPIKASGFTEPRTTR